MQLRQMVFASAGLLFIAMPLGAQPVETPAPTHASNESGTRIVCHRETVTGSRLPRTVCTSKRERDARRAADRANLERIQHATPQASLGGARQLPPTQ